MAELAFDTLSVARRLEKEFDFTPKQAEGTAKFVHEQLIGKVATKDDAKALKSDIEKLDTRVEKYEMDQANRRCYRSASSASFVSAGENTSELSRIAPHSRRHWVSIGFRELGLLIGRSMARNCFKSAFR